MKDGDSVDSGGEPLCSDDMDLGASSKRISSH